LKKLWTALLLLAIFACGLGYADYQQYREVSTLQVQVTDLTTEVLVQQLALVSQKKAIVQLRSNQKIIEQVLLKVVEALQSAEPEPHGPSQNSYVRN